jgi:hypothetical protein
MLRREMVDIGDDELQAVADAMADYITWWVLQQHRDYHERAGFYTQGQYFLDWHRTYLDGMRNHLLAQGCICRSGIPTRISRGHSRR